MLRKPNTRGQVYTLEAIISALLVIGAIVFALQSTAITPLTSSTANERLETQQQTIADDVLRVAAEQGTLAPTILYWDTSNKEFIGVPTSDGFVSGGPPTEFGKQLNNTFKDKNIAFNVYLKHRTADNKDTKTETIVYQGQPSDNAVSAHQIVMLYDNMKLNDGSGRTIKSVEDNLYIKDAASSGVYNVVEVRVVVWRM